MSRNYYSEINLHLVWHTKTSAPLLTADVETMVHRWIRQKLVNTKGAFVHEIGGIQTHVHACITLPPTVLISELVGQLKGGSAHEVNQRLGHGSKILQWQTGCGVVSFGTAYLDWVKAYVRNQPSHHSKGSTQDRLERITAPGES